MNYRTFGWALVALAATPALTLGVLTATLFFFGPLVFVFGMAIGRSPFARGFVFGLYCLLILAVVLGIGWGAGVGGKGWLFPTIFGLSLLCLVPLVFKLGSTSGGWLVRRLSSAH